MHPVRGTTTAECSRELRECGVKAPIPKRVLSSPWVRLGLRLGGTNMAAGGHYIPSPPPGGQLGGGALTHRSLPGFGKKRAQERAFEHFFLGCRSSAGGWRRQLPARESALGPTARGASVPSAQPLARARSGASRWSTGIQEQRGRRDRPQPPLQGLRRVFRRLARVIRGRHPLRFATVSFAMACGAAQSTQASTRRQ